MKVSVDLSNNYDSIIANHKMYRHMNALNYYIYGINACNIQQTVYICDYMDACNKSIVSTHQLNVIFFAENCRTKTAGVCNWYNGSATIVTP